MEKLTAIGRRKLDFTPKGQTNPVVGVQLFTTRPQTITEDGILPEKFFVSITSDLYPAVMLLTFPCEIEAVFNRYGKIDAFSVVNDNGVTPVAKDEKKGS